jgi:hypothetical protein
VNDGLKYLFFSRNKQPALSSWKTQKLHTYLTRYFHIGVVDELAILLITYDQGVQVLREACALVIVRTVTTDELCYCCSTAIVV